MSADDIKTAAIDMVLAHEGGLVDDPADPGGLTNFGIALKEHPELGAEAIRAMTRQTAFAWYDANFWQKEQGGRWGELPAAVACKIFDTAVPQSPAMAARVLQRALWACGKHVKEDGVLGTISITAAADVDAGALLVACRSEAAAQYRLDAVARPESAKFLGGWLARAYS